MPSSTSMDTVCINCFGQLNNPGGKCTVCGYNETTLITQPHHLRPRTILNGKYMLGRMLGEGGFGITYIGWDLNLDLKIAIKEYYPSGFVTRETTGTATVQPYTGAQGDYFLNGRERFINEAKSLAKFFSLPGIVSVKDFFQENGTAYIAMEYIEGQTLKDYLGIMGGKLPAEQVFNFMKPVMSSLAEVHKSGIIHRDISPDNIMISKEGYMKLLDFGAAREFAESGNKSLSIMLKPGFAPEEQYRTKGVQGPWTDVYALSATIYKCITGITPDEAIERVSEDMVRPPSHMGIFMTYEQDTAIMKGLAVKQNNRYQSVMDMYTALYEPNTPAAAPAAAPVNAIPPTMPVSSPPPVIVSIPKTKEPPPMAAAYQSSNMTFDSTQRTASDAKKKRDWIIFFATFFIGLIVIGGIIFLIMKPSSNKQNDEPKSESSAVDTPVSPSLREFNFAPNQPEPANDTPVSPSLVYKKGTVTDTGFYSEFLDLSFTTPEGYIIEPGLETDGDSTMEMIVTATDGSVSLYLLTEKPSKADITEIEYLENLKTQLDNVGIGYAFADNEIPIYHTIAGQTYHVLNAFTDDFRQDYMVRKINGRMVTFIVTCQSEFVYYMHDLIDLFQPLSAAEPLGAAGLIETDTSASVGTIHFPDPNFEAAIREVIEKPSGDITPADVAEISRLDVQALDITDLTGIEFFTSLRSLQASNNQLTSLDISKNERLEILYSSGNQLTSLDVSQNIRLKNLQCERNQLTKLDVSKNIDLEQLLCGENLLTELDVTKNTALVSLSVSNNQLSTIDLSQNQWLKHLYCGLNDLTTLDISNNIRLENLYCAINKLTVLDVSQNDRLEKIYCTRNYFPSKSAIIGLDEKRTEVDFDPQRN